MLSARPRAVVLGNGAIIVAGGRPALNFWVSVDDGGNWQTADIPTLHNRLVKDKELRFCDAFENATLSMNWAESSCYTQVVALSPSVGMVCYERQGYNGASGWSHSPPQCDPGYSTIFCMRVKVNRAATAAPYGTAPTYGKHGTALLKTDDHPPSGNNDGKGAHKRFDTATAAPTSMGERRHLLVDGALLANISGGLHFETSQPHGLTDEPVLIADAEWERGCWVSWYNSVLRDPSGRLRLYYSLYCTDPVPPSGLPAINSTKVLTALSVAISTDEGVRLRAHPPLRQGR
jgi:hypothetical protein